MAHPRPHRLITTLAVIIVVVMGFVALAAVVGPNWIGTYLVPVLVVFGVLVGSFGLLVWGCQALQQWEQDFLGELPRTLLPCGWVNSLRRMHRSSLAGNMAVRRARKVSRWDVQDDRAHSQRAGSTGTNRRDR